jgi:hypothetical protein
MGQVLYRSATTTEAVALAGHKRGLGEVCRVPTGCLNGIAVVGPCTGLFGLKIDSVVHHSDVHRWVGDGTDSRPSAFGNRTRRCSVAIIGGGHDQPPILSATVPVSPSCRCVAASSFES